MSSTSLDKEIYEKIKNAAVTTPAVYDNYPELKRLLEDLKGLLSIEEGEEGRMIELSGNFIDSIEEIAKDNLLITVLGETDQTAGHYNSLVDIYQFFKNVSDARKNAEKDVVKEEQSFLSIFDLFFSQDFLEAHKADSALIKTHNALVGLYDHYKKTSED